MEIDIFEGCRGCGKSTIAFKLRQKTSSSTLINPTGFPDDGKNGFKKISQYYNAWMMLLGTLASHDSKYIFDRFYFSEYAYSNLYKKYDFELKYWELNNNLYELAELYGVKINIFFLYLSSVDELESRLIRDKVPFANVHESATESLRQQKEYTLAFYELDKIYPPHENFKIHTIDTYLKSIDEIYGEVQKLKTS